MKSEQKINDNEINTSSKKEVKEKKSNSMDLFFDNFFDDFFELPLRLSKQIEDLEIRRKFEEEKRIPVTNLEEFFKLCERKENKWDNIPVTNLREFFELCEKTPIKSEIKKPIKEYSKSYISTTIYKNGHRIDETKEILRNENGEEEIIKEKIIDGKGKKIISKNGKEKIIEENKGLMSERYNSVLNDLFNLRPRKINYVRSFLPMRFLL